MVDERQRQCGLVEGDLVLLDQAQAIQVFMHAAEDGEWERP